MLRKYINNKKFLIGSIMLLIVLLIGVFASSLTKYYYDETFIGSALEHPSPQYLFGTDRLGRDVFSRVIYGTRISLLIAVLITVVSSLVGVPLGLLAGFYGKVVDNLIMRVVDIFISFPFILTGLLIAVLRGPGLLSVVISLSLSQFTRFARITRGLVLEQKEKDFVKAAKLTGENNIRIMLRYILPNCISALIVQSTLTMSYAILGEASLSYLGFGIRPPQPSWGVLLQQATDFVWEHSYLVIIPGLFIVFTVMSFNFLGDGLRDIFDPRYKRAYE